MSKKRTCFQYECQSDNIYGMWLNPRFLNSERFFCKDHFESKGNFYSGDKWIKAIGELEINLVLAQHRHDYYVKKMAETQAYLVSLDTRITKAEAALARAMAAMERKDHG